MNGKHRINESGQKENTELSVSPMFSTFLIVEATGFEPATSASRTQRSTKLSHASIHEQL